MCSIAGTFPAWKGRVYLRFLRLLPRYAVGGVLAILPSRGKPAQPADSVCWRAAAGLVFDAYVSPLEI